MPSTVIDAIRYDAGKKTLRIIFLSGAIYDYLAVPQKVYEEMMKAFSKGVFLNEHIKKQYSFKKIK